MVQSVHLSGKLNTSPLSSEIFVFIFFSEGTITNPEIWLVLSTVRLFLSLPAGRVTFQWVAEYIPPSSPIFINLSRFSGWAVFLDKDVVHYLEPINNLLNISFTSFISLWLTENNIYLSTSTQTWITWRWYTILTFATNFVIHIFVKIKAFEVEQ